MKDKILFVVGLAIDLHKKGIHANVSYSGENVLQLAIWATGDKPATRLDHGWLHIEPLISRTVSLLADGASVELDCIIEYMPQLLQKVSE
jgi:hypothetical protein